MQTRYFYFIILNHFFCLRLHPLSAALFPVTPDWEVIVGPAYKLGGGTDHQLRPTSEELPFNQVLCFVRH